MLEPSDLKDLSLAGIEPSDKEVLSLATIPQLGECWHLTCCDPGNPRMC